MKENVQSIGKLNEQFSERRRLAAEEDGEREVVRLLEATAKPLEKGQEP